MNARSIRVSDVAEIEVALRELSDPSAGATVFQPTLAIVLSSIKMDIPAISAVLNDAGIAIFGVSTNGEFIDETPGKESVAILFLDIQTDHFRILFDEFVDKNFRESTTALAKETLKTFSHPAFLLAGSHLETDGEQLLLGFEDVIGREVNIFGAMAGDDFSFTDQLVFTNGKSSNKGVLALALDENKISISGKATCGWKAVGTAKTVTKSEGNHVYTVDDIPVVDITAKFGGLENLTEDKNFYFELSTLFPLQLQRETGDPVMRPGLIIDWSDHSFYCSGTVPQGSKIRFSLPPDFDVVDKVIQGIEDLKEREMPEADALIVFSCAGRLVALGPLISQELEGIQNVWKVPTVGMFSNAELARATGGNLELHNLTTCCVALKEK